jgi:hypothetical protein
MFFRSREDFATSETGWVRLEIGPIRPGTPAQMTSSEPNYQSGDLVPFGTHRRLKPPDSLPDAARRAFVDLVASVPSNHFKAPDLGLLCRWAEMTALAEECAFHMAQPGGIVDEDGRSSAWVTTHANATKVLALLALRLRLGPQSRAMKAPKKEAGPVSYYDRQRAQRDWDKFEP